MQPEPSSSSTDDPKAPYIPRQLACIPCRSRRVKCDHSQPMCGACLRGGIECQWPDGRKKRKRSRSAAVEDERNRGQAVKLAGPPFDLTNVAQVTTAKAVEAEDDVETANWLDSLFTQPAPATEYSWLNAMGEQWSQAGDTGAVNGEESWESMLQTIPNDPRLMDALQTQPVTIQGKPGEDQALELYYYRFSGSTALNPGINRINLRLMRKPLTASPLMHVPHPETSVPSPQQYRQLTDIFDDEGMPYPHVQGPLFELFFKHLSQHFPAISRQRMKDRFESGTMSQFLSNCVCAVAARFSPSAEKNPPQYAAPFIAKAQEFIVPLTQLPTTETTSGLVLLAWASYGQGNESQLWQYSGMAIRMGIDIGIHEVSEIYDSPQHVIRTRLLFWTLFITDRVVSSVTGRPTSIPEDCVEIQLPDDQDFYPDPARDTDDYPFEPVEAVPFVSLVRLMVLVGRISNVLNGRRGKPRTLVSTTGNPAEVLVDLQERLVQFLAGLPESLKWSGDNLKRADSRGHSGIFLTLHLWSHAVLALTYHPELLKSSTGIATPVTAGMSHNLGLALASSRQVSECMVLADLLARTSFTSSPFLIQPLFVASMAFVHEMRFIPIPAAPGNSTDVFFVNMARQNLTSLLKALSAMSNLWAGADTVIALLEQRSGIRRPDYGVSRNIFISLPDTGLLRRFEADVSHPKNIAQPTETSLQESIARSSGIQTSPFWLADLMNGYTVENTSLAPAKPQDLQQLLDSMS